MQKIVNDPEPCLRDLPDWRYLLQEYYELYRYLPSGGSSRIRGHQRAVREAISRVLKANPAIRTQPPAVKPVTAHLKRALDEGRGEDRKRDPRHRERDAGSVLAIWVREGAQVAGRVLCLCRGDGPEWAGRE